MTGPTSPSRNPIPTDKFPRRMGCLGWAVLAAVSLVAIFFVGEGIAGAIHDARGRKIDRWGTELLAVLDSYGPIAPAEGHRSQTRLSDLWDSNNDPTRQWTYFGQATYTIETYDGDQKTPERAFEAFADHLVESDWILVSEATPDDGQYRYSKGEWDLDVFYHPEDATADGRNRVAFNITSPKAGGLRPA